MVPWAWTQRPCVHSQILLLTFHATLNTLLNFLTFYFLIYTEGSVQLYSVKGDIDMKVLRELHSTNVKSLLIKKCKLVETNSQKPT